MKVVRFKFLNNCIRVMSKPKLSEEERNALFDFFLDKPVDQKILSGAKHNTIAVRDWYRNLQRVDVYLAGHLTKETLEEFDKRRERLEKEGFTFYNPADLILSRFEKGQLDLEMLRKARTVFVSTPKISVGTFTEIGRAYGDKPIVMHYSGRDLYKEGFSTYDYIKEYSPLSFYHITDNLDIAFGCLLNILNGTVKYKRVSFQDKISGEWHSQRRCLNCSSLILE